MKPTRSSSQASPASSASARLSAKKSKKLRGGGAEVCKRRSGFWALGFGLVLLGVAGVFLWSEHFSPQHAAERLLATTAAPDAILSYSDTITFNCSTAGVSCVPNNDNASKKCCLVLPLRKTETAKDAFTKGGKDFGLTFFNRDSSNNNIVAFYDGAENWHKFLDNKVVSSVDYSSGLGATGSGKIHVCATDQFSHDDVNFGTNSAGKKRDIKGCLNGKKYTCDRSQGTWTGGANACGSAEKNKGSICSTVGRQAAFNHGNTLCCVNAPDTLKAKCPKYPNRKYACNTTTGTWVKQGDQGYPNSSGAECTGDEDGYTNGSVLYCLGKPDDTKCPQQVRRMYVCNGTTGAWVPSTGCAAGISTNCTGSSSANSDDYVCCSSTPTRGCNQNVYKWTCQQDSLDLSYTWKRTPLTNPTPYKAHETCDGPPGICDSTGVSGYFGQTRCCLSRPTTSCHGTSTYTCTNSFINKWQVYDSSPKNCPVNSSNMIGTRALCVSNSSLNILSASNPGNNTVCCPDRGWVPAGGTGSYSGPPDTNCNS